MCGLAATASAQPLVAMSPVTLLKPLQHPANTAGGQAYACIRRAVIEVDGVAVRRNRLSARKHDVVHVSPLFVDFLRAEDPLVASF